MGGGNGNGIVYMDSIIVPISLFLTIGYHAYLWHHLKTKPSQTSIGMNMLKRRAWLRQLNQGDDKKGMLAVQSLRNSLMFTILTATVTVIVTLCLAALTNNAFNAARILTAAHLFGSQSPRIMLLKYASASIFLLASFLCSSLAVGFLVDANFLINAIGEFAPAGGYTEAVVERGFAMAVVGNRVLCIAFPLLLWLFGPLPVALSSFALVWGLYELDFVASLSTN
ncbi:transmembrane protein [Perilla frutescens var. hirtella]|uniref:Transmembrane protein n=1 Tax=Perilla frutescens var. hirtella TaxID=608512 RepID=A0AAD4PAX8_PERFH|nr:transmembrane protein [Perilla frutescens var. hirtella]